MPCSPWCQGPEHTSLELVVIACPSLPLGFAFKLGLCHLCCIAVASQLCLCPALYLLSSAFFTKAATNKGRYRWISSSALERRSQGLEISTYIHSGKLHKQRFLLLPLELPFSQFSPFIHYTLWYHGLSSSFLCLWKSLLSFKAFAP